MEAHQHGARAIWFEDFIVSPKIAIANLGLIKPELFVGDASSAIEAARWRAMPSETEVGFKDRIRSDLAAENSIGVLVSIYRHAAFFEHNTTLLRPTKRPVVENSVAGE